MTKIHILGAGTPTPTPERFGSAYVVDTGDDLVMFDCGPAATHKLVKSGLFPTQIDHLFFTHHHFDHDADYPCFLLCRWDQSIGKEEVLKVRGPSLTEKITEGLIGEDGVFAHDWKARVGAPVSQRVFENRGGTLPLRLRWSMPPTSEWERSSRATDGSCGRHMPSMSSRSSTRWRIESNAKPETSSSRVTPSHASRSWSCRKGRVPS